MQTGTDYEQPAGCCYCPSLCLWPFSVSSWRAEESLCRCRALALWAEMAESFFYKNKKKGNMFKESHLVLDNEDLS